MRVQARQRSRPCRAPVVSVSFRRGAGYQVLLALAVLCVVSAGGGCHGSEDVESGPSPSPWVPETPTPRPVAKSWVSEGDDVAAKLAEPPYRYVRIVATFHEDYTYDIEATDAEGGVFPSNGDFITKESTVEGITRIMLFEQSPHEFAYEGMFEIDSSVTPNVMRYEVVQVEPYAGLEPPDEEEGFGSTNGGAYGDGYVQVYTRM